VRDHVYYVYILASQRNGTLYVGVTNDLIRRVQEHREGLVPGFTKRYRVKVLVYFEVHQEISEAIAREKGSNAGGAIGSFSLSKQKIRNGLTCGPS
jgi:putative endonuclease